MKDVRTVLEYSPGTVVDSNDENTNWHLALNAHHKSFVGHHYYQSVLKIPDFIRLKVQNFAKAN